MVLLLVLYAVGYLVALTVLIRYEPAEALEDYILLGAVSILWPAVLIGVIPWLVSKVIKIVTARTEA